MKNHLLYLIVITFFFSCGHKDFRRDSFMVTKILSGNQIGLLNGYTVNLIGIGDSDKSEAYLRKHVLNKDVTFTFDTKVPYRRIHPKTIDKSFYAYITTVDNVCVNSEVLQNNLSDLFLSPILNDSLSQYLEYAGVVHEKVKEEGEKTFEYGCKKELANLVEACDYMNPVTRDFAVKQAGKSAGEYNVGQICEIFSSIRPPNWHYVNDPKGTEFFSKASRTISETNLSGDCDDFAVLMYSMINAIGGEARINFVWGVQGGHAFTEVNVSEFSPSNIENTILRMYPGFQINTIYYQKDNGKIWLNLDWWAAYPGGPYTDYSKEMILYPKENECEGNY